MDNNISNVQVTVPEQIEGSVDTAQQTPETSITEEMDSANEEKLLVEQFLNENYKFRRNELSGKVEFTVINPEQTNAQKSDEEKYRALTETAMNSMLRRVEMALPDISNPKHHVEMLVYSEDICVFNPAKEIFRDLPEWDGKNHIANFFNRIPGLNAEQLYWLSVWFRSLGAHWLEMDSEHGNECVPTLIGAQGCGKSTFLRRILPPELREYFLDHVNLSNKNDKNMALTNNLIVNLDEMDQIKPTQHAELKQMLSKVRVNCRPIYGRVQEDRTRYASFVATTNNPHPLNDPTGSRRYICISIPADKLIDNQSEIDYKQLYAQVYHELTVDKARYWFTNEETIAIQNANQQFQAEMDITSIISNCFRIPKKDEIVKPLSVKDITKMILKQYPLLNITNSFNIRLGLTLKSLGFKLANSNTSGHHGNHYLIVAN